jgi:hypothetical protein
MATSSSSALAPRPKRLLTASGKLLDASNSAVPTISSHRYAIEAKRAKDAKRRHDQLDASRSSLSVALDSPIPTSTPSSPPITDAPDISSDSDQERQPRKSFFFQRAQQILTTIDVELQQAEKDPESS